MKLYSVDNSHIVERADAPFVPTINIDFAFQKVPHLAVEELRLALVESQQQLQIAQQQIKSLEETTLKLRANLLETAKKCEKAVYFANHDELTGLPNRRLLFDRLQQAISQSDRQHKQIVLLFIDLDKFKAINDHLGHEIGDQLLQKVAERLSASIRSGDTTCRYGGDEFLLMLTEIDSKEHLNAVIEKISKCLAATYELDSMPVSISASIGVSVYQNDGQTCNELIKKADMAMYQSKLSQTHLTNNLVPKSIFFIDCKKTHYFILNRYKKS